MWETELFLESFPRLLRAFIEITLVVTVLASILAAVLGLAAAAVVAFAASALAIGRRDLRAG